MRDRTDRTRGGDEVARVVVPRDRIAERVRELAAEIASCLQGEELTILAVMTGSLIFLADLVRELPGRMRIDLVSISSYPGRTTDSKGPEFISPVRVELKGKHVLVLDDILDTGRTLEVLLSRVEKMEPASLRSCVLLVKRRPDLTGRVRPDFVGFEVEPEFLVGYGLDFDNLYRNLPDVCVLGRHDFSKVNHFDEEGRRS